MDLWKHGALYPVNRHRTLASPLPSHRTQQPSRCSFIHTLYLRPGCVWLHPGKPLWWTATSVFPGGTNNEMEASALLAGLQWIREHHPQQAVLIVGDSAIVAAMAAATMRVRAPNLAPLIRDIHHIINQLGHIGIRSVPRAFNVAADSLSNGIMDQDATRSLHKSVADTDCPLQELQWSDPFTCGCPPIYWVPEPVYDRSQWNARWSLVLLDFERVKHLVQNRFLQWHIGEIPRSHVLPTLGPRWTLLHALRRSTVMPPLIAHRHRLRDGGIRVDGPASLGFFAIMGKASRHY
ncbi:hypothetical protein PI124_g12314 [Phytophthora idaei]|nr:hypothetical protein PI124_g12314 [Phytophthora idaei]